jgi:phosphate transport system substrate-binding protein
MAVVLLMMLAGIAAAAQGETPASPSPPRPDGRQITVDPNIPAYAPVPPLSGDLHIVGGLSRLPGSPPQFWPPGAVRPPLPLGPSSTDALVYLWVEIFKTAHPSVRVYTALYASAQVAGVLNEQSAQLGVASRELMPQETYAFRDKAFKPLGIPVGGGSYDTWALLPSQAVIVSKDNPLQRLTLAQLDAIFSKTRKRGYKEDITRWGQLGLTGEWADKPIHLYTRSQPDGVVYFFALRALAGGEFKDTFRWQESQVEVMKRIDEDRYGIAFVNRNYVRPDTRVVALAETEAGPFSVGSFEEVLNQTYPLSRVIYLYVNSYPDKPIDPLAKEFIRVALSQEGQRAVARSVYLPLPLAKVRESLRMLE